ncbi:MAG: hypothetical protein WCK37_00645 [Candidatus Falkowbacteria bacterium]
MKEMFVSLQPNIKENNKNSAESLDISKQQRDVYEVFKASPELSKIGTKEQYAKYLETIFPESVIKNIVYHGTNNKFEKFEKRRREDKFDAGTIGNGIYFAESKDVSFGSNLENTKASILNVKNPLVGVDEIILHIGKREEKGGRYTGNHIIYNEFNLKRRFLTDNKEYYDIVTNFIKDNGLEGRTISDFEISELYSEYLVKLGYDGIVSNGTSAFSGGREFVVFEPEQIHILGSNDDIENFKKFVESAELAQ